MPATTISRTAYNLLVDDDGSGNTGSVWDKADINDILSAVDALIANAITFGGTVSALGFGTHAFSAGGAGFNALSVRNTTAGTGNGCLIYAGTDVAAQQAIIAAYSSTYTTGAYDQNSGSALIGN